MIYLLYGEEKYDLNQKLEKIKKEFNNLSEGINLFYITSENIDELSSVLQGVTFFGTEKVIIIKDTKLKFSVELLKNIDKDITVVVIEDSVDKRTSDYKNLAKIAECFEFKFMDEAKVKEYIMQVLKKYNLSISNEDAEYMANMCGNQKSNIINELNKLVIYLDSEGKITKDVINKVCSKTLNAKIFDVLANIVNKKKQVAISQLDELLEQKEPIVKIYIMLYKQVKQMYLIKYLKEKNSPNITQILGIHPFVFKNLSKSCDAYTLKELKSILNEFDIYDEKTKNGEMDFEIGLKKIISIM